MNSAAPNWDNVRLVVFDVDGTLYDQRAMRLRMLIELAGNVLRRRNLTTVRTLGLYRRLREALSEKEISGFEDVLVARTAEATGMGEEMLCAIVSEWMEKRPLSHIRACRYPHLVELFAALRRRGKIIGIFSDYPAFEKLHAMGLAANHIVAAGDPNVGILKPHPRGLEVLMNTAGIGPSETVFVGDRVDRDGEAARRAGVTALIRSDKPIDGWLVFSSFSDALFAPLLEHRANISVSRSGTT